jgi:hypothetical protein
MTTSQSQPPAPDLKKINALGLGIAGTMIAIQIFLLIGTYINSPGYLKPFVQSAPGIVMLAAGALWQVFGIWYALRPAEPAVAIRRWYFAEAFCIAPIFLVPLLGPALVTIMQAFGLIGAS